MIRSPAGDGVELHRLPQNDVPLSSGTTALRADALRREEHDRQKANYWPEHHGEVHEHLEHQHHPGGHKLDHRRARDHGVSASSQSIEGRVGQEDFSHAD